jgi:hypothetical protein
MSIPASIRRSISRIQSTRDRSRTQALTQARILGRILALIRGRTPAPIPILRFRHILIPAHTRRDPALTPDRLIRGRLLAHIGPATGDRVPSGAQPQ